MKTRCRICGLEATLGDGTLVRAYDGFGWTCPDTWACQARKNERLRERRRKARKAS